MGYVDAFCVVKKREKTVAIVSCTSEHDGDACRCSPVLLGGFCPYDESHSVIWCLHRVCTFNYNMFVVYGCSLFSVPFAIGVTCAFGYVLLSGTGLIAFILLNGNGKVWQS